MVMTTANEEGTGAGTAATGSEGWVTGVDQMAEVLESAAGGLLQGLTNPHCPAWIQLGISGQAAAG